MGNLSAEGETFDSNALLLALKLFKNLRLIIIMAYQRKDFAK